MKNFTNTLRKAYKKAVPECIRNPLIACKIFLLKLCKTKPRRKDLKFEIHVAEHCNLNCAGCTHFSPLAGEIFLDIESYKKDCSRLAALTGGYIEKIKLLGGEPLLHPELIEIIKITRQFFAGPSSIEIVTNGILLPKQGSEFWQTCKENDVVISITKYPIKLDIDAIESLAKKYCVKLFYSDNVNKNDAWRKEPLDLSGTQNKTSSFLNCFSGNTCINLVNGKLFTCQMAAYIHHFNAFFGTNLEITKDDFISIYEANSVDEILRFFTKPIPFCRYCNIKKMGLQQWKTSKKDISEWI